MKEDEKQKTKGSDLERFAADLVTDLIGGSKLEEEWRPTFEIIVREHTERFLKERAF